MENQIFNQNQDQVSESTATTASFAQAGAMSKTFLSNVFAYMFAGLAISGIAAWVFGNSYTLMSYLVSETGGLSALGWIVMFAPLGFVFFMGLRYEKMSAMGMLTSFILFSLIDGISLSFIFLAFTAGSIYKTFAIAALMFGVMALLGYTTKTDLTKLGGLLMMALFGLIIAMVVNFFLNSAMMDYIISIVGVLVFTGLTAYDVQKLKRIGGSITAGTQGAAKAAIWGALALYLDFINLFLFLLRLFGSRD